MTKEKTFVLYDDFVVREYRGKVVDEIFFDFIGVIQVTLSLDGFYSEKYGMFSDGKKRWINFYDYTIVNGVIRLNRFFKITKILESGYNVGEIDTYYVRVNIFVEDSKGNEKKYVFVRSPSGLYFDRRNVKNWVDTICQDIDGLSFFDTMLSL